MDLSQPPVENPQSLLGLGIAWTRVGYGVLLLALIAFGLNLLVRPILPIQLLTPLSVSTKATSGTSLVDTPKGKVAVPKGYQIAVADNGEVQVYPLGYSLIGGKEGGAPLKTSAMGMISLFVIVFSGLAGVVWMLADIVDRRKRFVWLLPMAICPVLGVLHALPLALYLFFARETPVA